MRINKKYSILFILAFIGLEAIGQKSLNEQINVIKEYKPILENSEKIKSNPEIETSKAFEIEFNYTLNDVVYDSVHKNKEVEIEKMGKESIPKLLHSRALIGGGNYGGFISEYSYANNRNKNSVLNFTAKHLSHNPSGEYTNLDASENKINLFGKQLFSNSNLSGGIDYNRKAYNLYGNNFSDENKNVRQILNSIGFNSQYNLKVEGDSSLTQASVYMNGYIMEDAFKASEKNIDLGLNVSDNSSGLPLEGNFNFDLNDYLNNSGNLIQNNLFNSKFIYHYTDSNLDVQIGFKTNSQFGSLQEFHFFPHITSEYKFTGDVVSAFGGLTGNTEKNTMKSLLNKNNFLSKDLVIRNTTERLNLFIGLRASFSGAWGFSSSLKYIKLENMPFFFEENVQPRTFQILYDSEKGSLVNWNISAIISASERFRMEGNIDIQKYNAAIFKSAYYFPSTKANIISTYNIGNKFYIGTETFIIGKRKYLNVKNEDTTLAKIIDANLTIDYKYSKTVGIFIKLNNLFQGKYQYWNNYPVYGFNILGGLNISF